MTLWLRLKMLLKGFNHKLIDPQEYQLYRTLPTQPVRTKHLHNSHKRIRSMIRADTKLHKLLGDGTYVVEVTVRDGEPRVAVYKGLEERNRHQRQIRISYSEKFARQAIFSVSYIGRMVDPMTTNGPIKLYYNPEEPLFAYDPQVHVSVVLEPVPQASAPRWSF